jgi:hypothetical protein
MSERAACADGTHASKTLSHPHSLFIHSIFLFSLQKKKLKQRTNLVASNDKRKKLIKSAPDFNCAQKRESPLPARTVCTFITSYNINLKKISLRT